MTSIQGNKITRTQWLAHVEQWRASGLTKSEYCQVNGITVHALSYWITRHREHIPEGGKLTLIPGKITGNADAPHVGSLILHCPNGSQLHFPDGTPTVWLGALLAQLR